MLLVRLCRTRRCPVLSSPTALFFIVYSIDCADADRIGAGKELFDSAKKRVMIDHHISNPIFGDVNYAKGEIGSACEVLYTL